jgi:ubiquinone/menaquinone biosynthesis C-methylase UbiE
MSDMTPQLQQILGKVIADLGGTANAALVIVGDRLGLFKKLAEIGPATSAELAKQTGTNERLVREWLAAQAASEYVTYDAETKRFRMTEEQAQVLADSESPFFMAGGFFSAAATVHDEQKLAEAFRTGKGIGWGDHCNCLFCGVERFYRTGYAANLVQNWLPALTDVTGKLEAGALVADIGCGHGASTLVMARAFPKSRFVGFDYHGPSIERATAAAGEQGLRNVRFEIATAQDFPLYDGEAYDLAAIFDALHDMGDPRGAARQACRNLKDDGTWMIVEPAAADELAGNLNPVGRVYYAMSTSVCVPTAMSQNGGEALGAQAGPAAIAEIAKSGGFTRFRTAAATPFNLVFEARP